MFKFLTLKAESKNTNSPNDVQSEPITIEMSWRQKMDKKLSEMFEEPKSSHQDITNYKARQETLEKFYNDRSETTWRERLDFMWATDEFGFLGPELLFVKQATEVGFFGGMVVGSYFESAKVYRIFLEQNKYTMFQHPREAQRALQERIVLAIIQGGWRSGWRMGVLAFTFTSVTQSLTVVRNYINPVDYALGGGVMGAVYKFHMGPKGMVGAGIGGAFLGFQAGILTWGLQKLSGETVAERWSREYGLVKDKKEIKLAKAENKDPRREIVIEETNRAKPSDEVIVNDGDDEDDYWVRKIVMKVTEWMELIGFTRPHSEDSFRIINDVQNTSEVETKPQKHNLDIANDTNTSDHDRTDSHGTK